MTPEIKLKWFVFSTHFRTPTHSPYNSQFTWWLPTVTLTAVTAQVYSLRPTLYSAFDHYSGKVSGIKRVPRERDWNGPLTTSVSNSERPVFAARGRNVLRHGPVSVCTWLVAKRNLCSMMSIVQNTSIRIYFKTLFFAVFTSWLGLHSVLTRVTASRWRWASVDINFFFLCCQNSTDNMAISLTRWHKPPTERRWGKKELMWLPEWQN